jgi:glycine/D-amino acid oxidase-like deaminating enzyme
MYRPAEAARDTGLSAEFMTETELPFAIAGAVRMSRQAQFHSRKYLLALTADLRQHGGTPYEATRVDEGGPRPWEVAAVTFANSATTSACTCMALSTKEIQTLVGEVRRVLRPGGTFLYTACRNRDTSYDTGAAHGDGIIEHGGFAVHFFPRDLVSMDGWTLDEVHTFDAEDVPCRLWRFTQPL